MDSPYIEEGCPIGAKHQRTMLQKRDKLILFESFRCVRRVPKWFKLRKNCTFQMFYKKSATPNAHLLRLIHYNGIWKKPKFMWAKPHAAASFVSLLILTSIGTYKYENLSQPESDISSITETIQNENIQSEQIRFGCPPSVTTDGKCFARPRRPPS